MNLFYNIFHPTLYITSCTVVGRSGKKASKLRASGLLSAVHFLSCSYSIFVKTVNTFYEHFLASWLRLMPFSQNVSWQVGPLRRTSKIRDSNIEKFCHKIAWKGMSRFKALWKLLSLFGEFSQIFGTKFSKIACTMQYRIHILGSHFVMKWWMVTFPQALLWLAKSLNSDHLCCTSAGASLVIRYIESCHQSKPPLWKYLFK